MGRPENSNAADTKRVILQMATARFADRGFVGATVRAIASDAGLTLATVHHHFGTKGQLYGACLEQAYASQLTHAPSIVALLSDSAKSKGDRVEDATREAMRLALKHPTRSRFLLRFALFEGEQSPAKSESRRELESAYAETVTTGLAELLGHDDPKALRVALVGLGYLLARFAAVPVENFPVIGGNTPKREEVADYVVRVARATLVVP